MIKWWKRYRYWRRCNHFIQRGIYGDEIFATGGLRSQCIHCGRFLSELPTVDRFGIFTEDEVFDEGKDQET